MDSGFLRVFFTEWKKFFRTPRLMFWVLVVPLLLFFFLGSLFQNGVPRDLPVSVVDYDNSALSRKILRFVDASPLMKISDYQTNEAEAQASLRRADVFATIIIPQNFQKDIYKGKTPQAVCYTNSQFILPAGLIQRAFLTTVSTFSAGIKLDKQQKKGQSYEQALGEVRNIKLDSHVLYNPYMNYNYYLGLALFPMMFQIVVMVVSVYVLGLVMKRHKALKLYELGRKNAWAVLAGKLLPYTLLFLFIGWIMNNYLFENIDIPMKGSNFSVLIITALMILSYQSMAVFFVAFSKNLRSALTFGGGFSALAFSFSGYTFPMEGIPKTMQILGQTFPYTHFIKAYVNTAIKGLPPMDSAWSIIALMIFILLGLISVPKFSQLLKKNGYEPEF